MRTQQHLFNTIVAHARGMAHKAEQPDGGGSACVYRAPDGGKCFVGALIPDEVYTPEMDTPEWSIGQVLEAIGLRQHLSLLLTLREVHDCDAMEDWERDFEIIARRFNLTYTPRAVDAPKETV
jgi:hypothetical protein